LRFAPSVQQAAGVVDDVGDVLDIALEQPKRVGVREHQRGSVVADGRLQRLDVDAAVVTAR